MRDFMKRFWRGVSSLRFIILTLLVFCALDFALTSWAPVENSTLFQKNDFEKTILSHGGATAYKRVIYGNSTLISSYIEEQSDTGYVNFGLDYGTVSDLYQMLSEKHITVTDELVLVLNCFVLMDTLETNPTYPWHRRGLEPYVFFQRDRLAPVFEAMAANLLDLTNPFNTARYTDMKKTVYHGVMTDEELEEKIASHAALFWWQGIDYYEKNLRDLGRVAEWCGEHDVRLRVVWGPWNNDVAIPENFAQVKELADDVLSEHGVERLDMMDVMERKYFYDIGHLNYEYGAVYFTEVLDEWLLSSLG